MTHEFDEYNRPPLGHHVKFTARLRSKTSIEGKIGEADEKIVRTWNVESVSGSGIYIGIRYEQNGYSVCDEFGSKFTSTGDVPAALVITSEHDSVPVFVPFENIRSLSFEETLDQLLGGPACL